MNGFADLQQPIMQALGMAVLHSLWQGVLLYFLVRMILSFVPERKSGARYSITYISLSLLFLGFMFSFYSEWQLATHVVQASDTQAAGAIQYTGYASLLEFWNRFFSFRYIHLFADYMPLIAVCYTAGVLLLCGKMIWSVSQVYYLRRQVMLPDSLTQQQFLRLKEQSGVKKNVLLRLSEKVTVPVMFGYLKPVILIPLSLINRLDAQQMETVLLHELAHIRRNDYLWNLLQMVMETLLFFNPAAWLLSRIIREEREHRCDDYVLNITKTPLPYAHALLLLEENRISVTDAVMAASGNDKNSLLNRIKRMTSMKKEIKNSQRTLATITAVVLIAAMACFATAFGQEKKDDPKKINKSYSKVTVINDNGKVTVDDNGKVTTFPDSNGDTTGMAEAMRAVPEALEMAGKTLEDIDWKEIQNTVKMSMASADQAMKEIDWNDIQSKVNDAMKEAHKSMKEINWEEINDEMEGARKEMAQAMKEMHQSMKETDWTEINKAMDEAKEEMKKAKIVIKQSIKDRKDARDKEDDNDNSED